MQPVRGQEPYVRCWMHTAMVGYQGEKMSKSLGNLVMVSDLLKTYAPDALRLYLGAHPYREAWSYEEKDLQKSQALAERLRLSVQAEGGQGGALDAAEFAREFSAAMEDDLGTPGALRALEGLAVEILEAAKDRRDVREAQAALRKYGRVFGLRLGEDAPEERVVQGWEARR